MIRGAIAFGLVLRLEPLKLITGTDAEKKLSVITSTAITLVVGTTIIFGSTMMPVQKWLLPKLSEEEIIKQMVGNEDEDDAEDDQAQNLLEEIRKRDEDEEEKAEFKMQQFDINKSTNVSDQKQKKKTNEKRGSNNHAEGDHFEEFLHPNMRNSIAKPD